MVYVWNHETNIRSYTNKERISFRQIKVNFTLSKTIKPYHFAQQTYWKSKKCNIDNVNLNRFISNCASKFITEI